MKHFKVVDNEGEPYGSKNKVWTIGAWKLHCKASYKDYVSYTNATLKGKLGSVMAYEEWYHNKFFNNYRALIIDVVREE